MGFFSFGFKNIDTQGADLPDIFPLALTKIDFTNCDIVSTYTKILTDTVERIFGIPKDIEPLLWDNCVQNEANNGLISLLAQAMAEQSDLYLVYVESVKVLRRATREEQAKIQDDYKAENKSSVGVYISFKNYRRTEVLLIYSAFEYCILASLNKTLNLSKAIQFKMSEMRSSVALIDSSKAIDQAKGLAKSLGKGFDVMLDAKDIIETAKPDTSSTEKAMTFLDAKRAFILGLPLSYISGIQTGGIGSTGEADMRAVERGLKQYFVSILRPALKAIFDINTEFKSQDFRQVTSAIEVLKTFDLVSDDNLSQAAKQDIIARMFELDISAEKKALKKEANEAAKITPAAIPAKTPDQTV